MTCTNRVLLFSLWIFSAIATTYCTRTTAAFVPPPPPPPSLVWKLGRLHPKKNHEDGYHHQNSHFMHSGGVEDTMDFSPFDAAASSSASSEASSTLPLKLIQDFEASSPSTVLFGSSASASSARLRPSPTALYSTTSSSSSSVVFNTACDDVNRPPSLNILLKSIQELCPASSSNTDIRGRFVNHQRLGSLASVAQAIGKTKGDGKIPSLTPIAAYCLGHALAHNLHVWKQQQQQASSNNNAEGGGIINIMIGRDPRSHGTRLADAVARGAESYQNAKIKVYYTGIATTPGCAALCLKSSSSTSTSSDKNDDDDDMLLSLSVDNDKANSNDNNGMIIDLDASVMITASHLPEDRNGLKFFSKLIASGGFEHEHIQQLAASAMDCAVDCYNRGTLPPSSGIGAVMCTAHVNWMPAYAATLKHAIIRQIGSGGDEQQQKPLKGLSIVLNAGHGSGGFFQQVLDDLGADTRGSIGCTPIINDNEDGGHDDKTTSTGSSSTSFPNGVPNPEYPAMYQATVKACRDVQADLGIMLDTDADRCAFVVPSRRRRLNEDNNGDDYEPLNRNRLIALLGVVFAKEYPGSTVVTCSVTSEGLSSFLQDHLGLKHVRYLKGYANVIRKAKEITYSLETQDVAELAIETSGHCAMRENNYIDDGTYTAVKVVSLLAQQQQQQESKSKSLLLDLISEMKELSVLDELRFPTLDASLNTMRDVFDFCALAIEQAAMMKNVDDSTNDWELDTENLEGIRVRFGNRKDGQFFMLRKSLHDPIISLQIEGTSRESVQEHIIQPLWQLFNKDEQIKSNLDLSVLQKYK